MNNRKYVIFSILLLFFLSALMMLRQIKSSGYSSSTINDTFTYTSWAWQFIEALREGIIYPRWLSLDFWGYGSPTFILYPPLAFYLVAVPNVFTHSVIAAMNITKFIALFLSGIGIFFLIKEFYSEKIALISASFYIILPFNILEFYLIGTFASMISLMWFPPILLFTHRYFKDGQFKNIIYAGACYGGLILTHLINAYMFTFVIVAFMIFMAVAKKNFKGLIAIPFIIMIGFSISAAYLLPLIYEKQFINTKAFIEGGFHFANFFILPNLSNKFSPDHFWRACYNEILFHILFFCLLILLAYIQILKLNNIKYMKNVNNINKFFLWVALSTMFLLFGVSMPLWEAIPFFKYIQFPIRWLNITTLAVVFLSATIFWVLIYTYKAKRWHKYSIVLLFFLCLLLCYGLLRDFKYISSVPIFTEQELLPVKAVNWTMEHLPAGVEIDKINNDAFKKRIVILKGEGKAEILGWKSAERIIEIAAQKPLTLRIRTFNFPGWKSYIDGKQTEIKTEKNAGAMLIDIPRGKHTLVLKFEDTPIRYYSKLISLFSFAIMILISLFLGKNR
jgi:uncharacterized membrane protein